MNAFEVGDAPVILDGGLATALEARGHDLSDAVWSARLLADAPSEVVAAHEAFFRAGAQIALTASYQASFEGFAARGVRREEAAELMRRSIRLARQAAGPGDFVAASVGPYGAMLADGSEYRGRYGRTVRELRAFHRPRIDVLAAAEPDFFALETVPDVDEAEALVDAVADCGVPAWLSYSVAGEHTRAGQPLPEAFSVARGVDSIFAVGVNCSDPDDVPRAVEVAREVTGKPVVAYPNSGESWDAQRRAWAGSTKFSAARALEWYAAGARLIGGCCRVGAAEIAALAREFA